MTDFQESLPPGWESKVDLVTGKSYFINHHTKTTTWDDPRKKPGFSSSPAGKHSEHIPLQEFKSTSRSSPLTLRGAKVQDSSLTTTTTAVNNSDPDEGISKISAMFPTVSDTHIRLLMKNCRYMKSIFPKADETVILEVLYNNENNIQKASEILTDMGFQKKDTVKIMQQRAELKLEAAKAEQEQIKKDASLQPTPPKVKTAEEKITLKEHLKAKYKDVADHLITIALESVDYNEVKANQILEIIVQENSVSENDSTTRETENTEEQLVEEPEIAPTSVPVSTSRQSLKSLLKSEKVELERSTYARPTNVLSTNGPNPSLAQGPNDKILLEEYINWQGPNFTFRIGPQGLQKGPNRLLLGTRNYQARGSNPEMVKGPKFGLARGSIFSQLKNIAAGESRGK